MAKTGDITWLKEPEEHDYPAAESYLCLLYDEERAKQHVETLRHAPVSAFKAKDVFRASGLSLLGISNAHVEKDRQKIRSGHALSPLLLLRDAAHGKVIIADGYHRLCAIYADDEDAVIPCKIA
ncbi:MAG TPA: hypothetical protein VLQ80_27925 [Candidatus Saccharimonadia bacterium]|nr:hypothetical protein [Candidatus Saccharimonadia bacterium]